MEVRLRVLDQRPRSTLADLPRDSYAALGMCAIAMIWVCPSFDLVVAHNPGLLLDTRDEAGDRAPGLLRLIVDACE